MVSPIWFILLPLFSAFLLYTLSPLKKDSIAGIVSFSAIGFNVIASILLLSSITGVLSVTIAGFAPPLGIGLYVDKFTLLFLLVINSIALLSVIYSFGYIKQDRNIYQIFFLLLVAGSNGMVLTGDIFNLFVFFEIVCIASYALVAFDRNKNAIEASIKYLILGTVGSLFILIAIAFIYMTMGTLSLADIAIKFQTVSLGYKLLIPTLLFVGFGVEAAIFPLNAWLPDAHSSAPSSISAVLSGFVIEIPLFILVRVILVILNVSSFSVWLISVATLTIIIGEIAAFRQTNIKRALAYSSMGQVGLILLALGVGTSDAVNGAMLQFLNHAIAKSLLFFVVGIFIKETGSYNFKDYAGIAKKMPILSFTFVIGALSLIGVPPLFGFFSKFRLITAVMNSGNEWSIAIALLGTVIETIYFVRIIQIIYKKSEIKISSQSTILPIFVSLLLAVTIVGLVFVIPQTTILTGNAVDAFLKIPTLLHVN